MSEKDPVMTCQPLGLPRQGPPRGVYQTANDITFLYSQYADAGGGPAEFRVIPTDAHDHDPDAEYGAELYGDTVGHGEGDPEVLVEPWVLTPWTLVPNPNPNAGLLPERGSCEVYEDAAGTNQIRH